MLTGSVATISSVNPAGRSGGPVSNSVRVWAARLALGGMKGARSAGTFEPEGPAPDRDAAGRLSLFVRS